jgi:hypothetical protein
MALGGRPWDPKDVVVDHDPPQVHRHQTRPRFMGRCAGV